MSRPAPAASMDVDINTELLIAKRKRADSTTFEPEDIGPLNPGMVGQPAQHPRRKRLKQDGCSDSEDILSRQEQSFLYEPSDSPPSELFKIAATDTRREDNVAVDNDVDMAFDLFSEQQVNHSTESSFSQHSGPMKKFHVSLLTGSLSEVLEDESGFSAFATSSQEGDPSMQSYALLQAMDVEIMSSDSNVTSLETDTKQFAPDLDVCSAFAIEMVHSEELSPCSPTTLFADLSRSIHTEREIVQTPTTACSTTSLPVRATSRSQEVLPVLAAETDSSTLHLSGPKPITPQTREMEFVQTGITASNPLPQLLTGTLHAGEVCPATTVETGSSTTQLYVPNPAPSHPREHEVLRTTATASDAVSVFVANASPSNDGSRGQDLGAVPEFSSEVSPTHASHLHDSDSSADTNPALGAEEDIPVAPASTRIFSLSPSPVSGDSAGQQQQSPGTDCSMAEAHHALDVTSSSTTATNRQPTSVKTTEKPTRSDSMTADLFRKDAVTFDATMDDFAVDGAIECSLPISSVSGIFDANEVSADDQPAFDVSNMCISPVTGIFALHNSAAPEADPAMMVEVIATSSNLRTCSGSREGSANLHSLRSSFSESAEAMEVSTPTFHPSNILDPSDSEVLSDKGPYAKIVDFCVSPVSGMFSHGERARSESSPAAMLVEVPIVSRGHGPSSLAIEEAMEVVTPTTPSCMFGVSDVQLDRQPFDDRCMSILSAEGIFTHEDSATPEFDAAAMVVEIHTAALGNGSPIPKMEEAMQISVPPSFTSFIVDVNKTLMDGQYTDQSNMSISPVAGIFTHEDSPTSEFSSAAMVVEVHTAALESGSPTPGIQDAMQVSVPSSPSSFIFAPNKTLLDEEHSVASKMFISPVAGVITRESSSSPDDSTVIAEALPSALSNSSTSSQNCDTSTDSLRRESSTPNLMGVLEFSTLGIGMTSIFSANEMLLDRSLSSEAGDMYVSPVSGTFTLERTSIPDFGSAAMAVDVGSPPLYPVPLSPNWCAPGNSLGQDSSAPETEVTMEVSSLNSDMQSIFSVNGLARSCPSDAGDMCVSPVAGIFTHERTSSPQSSSVAMIVEVASPALDPVTLFQSCHAPADSVEHESFTPNLVGAMEVSALSTGMTSIFNANRMLLDRPFSSEAGDMYVSPVSGTFTLARTSIPDFGSAAMAVDVGSPPLYPVPLSPNWRAPGNSLGQDSSAPETEVTMEVSSLNSDMQSIFSVNGLARSCSSDAGDMCVSPVAGNFTHERTSSPQSSSFAMIVEVASPALNPITLSQSCNVLADALGQDSFSSEMEFAIEGSASKHHISRTFSNRESFLHGSPSLGFGDMHVSPVAGVFTHECTSSPELGFAATTVEFAAAVHKPIPLSQSCHVPAKNLRPESVVHNVGSAMELSTIIPTTGVSNPSELLLDTMPSSECEDRRAPPVPGFSLQENSPVLGVDFSEMVVEILPADMGHIQSSKSLFSASNRPQDLYNVEGQSSSMAQVVVGPDSLNVNALSLGQSSADRAAMEVSALPLTSSVFTHDDLFLTGMSVEMAETQTVFSLPESGSISVLLPGMLIEVGPRADPPSKRPHPTRRQDKGNPPTFMSVPSTPVVSGSRKRRIRTSNSSGSFPPIADDHYGSDAEIDPPPSPVPVSRQPSRVASPTAQRPSTVDRQEVSADEAAEELRVLINKIDDSRFRNLYKKMLASHKRDIPQILLGVQTYFAAHPGETSASEDAKPRRRRPKRHTEDSNSLARDIRRHVKDMLQPKSSDGQIKKHTRLVLTSVTPPEVDLFIKGKHPGPTVANFRLDFLSKGVWVPWNKAAAVVFIADIRSSGGYEKMKDEELERVFRTFLLRLRRAYGLQPIGENGEKPQGVLDQDKAARTNQRRRRLSSYRLRAVDAFYRRDRESMRNIHEASAYLQNLYTMSGDETSGEGPSRTFVVTPPAWRSQELSDLLKYLSAIHVGLKYQGQRKYATGAFLMPRHTNADGATNNEDAPPRLPVNFYESAWLDHPDHPERKVLLKPAPAIDLTLPREPLNLAKRFLHVRCRDDMPLPYTL